MSRHLVWYFAVLCLTACTGGSDYPCIPGTVDCTCSAGSCADGALCVNGSCRAVTCRVGEQGCACAADYTCAKDASGAWLTCEGGLCASPACPDGEKGCACIGAGLCADGLVCSDASGIARCEVPDCPPGAEGCTCPLDRVCGAAASGAALVCVDRACVVATCTAGTNACACRADFGCDGGLVCDADHCRPVDCLSGAIGCRCLPGGACADPSLACADGLCQEPGCPAGAAGCGCLSGGACLQEGLVCDNGRCLTPTCVMGDVGCVCFRDGTCTLGASCTSGWCTETGCTTGTRGCACLDGTCTNGDYCMYGTVCVDATGHAGGACLSNRSCYSGARCEGGTCVACLSGTLACACREQTSCDTGLSCFAGRCVADESLSHTPPTEPACYTPCTADLYRQDGSVAVCSSEGLLPGCLTGWSCVAGSCLTGAMTLDAGDPPTPLCASAVDCPDYQTCIDSHCYSECEADADCQTPLVCDRKVCRIPCDTTAAACAAGTTCEAKQGTSGFCMPLDDATTTSTATGSFLLVTKSLAFSSVASGGSVYVNNTGSSTVSLVVKKRFHAENHQDPSDDRRVNDTVNGRPCSESGECPLAWLAIGYETTVTAQASSPVDSLTFELAGGCGVTPIKCTSNASCGAGLHGNVCNADGFCACDLSVPGAPAACKDATACTARIDFDDAAGFADPTIRSWHGGVDVELPGVSRDGIELIYRGGPTGRFVGSVYYYANFEDQGLDTWLANGRRDQDLAYVQNALVSQWGAFRHGRMDWEQFQAVLQATETQSWQFPNVQARCDDAACYLHSRGEGIAVYSSSLLTQPIPSGVVELPFAMNITSGWPAGAPTPPAFPIIGKIDSSAALQYPGDARVQASFASDPGLCAAGHVDCVAFLDGFQASVVTGGRYITDASDTLCTRRPDNTYDRLSFPWLVPGFAPPGYVGNIDHLPDTFYECRDTLLPRDPTSGNTQEIKDANMRAAAANPFPDAQTRERTLTLVDGVLVNGEEIFLMFKESFASDGRPYTGYGYLHLKRQPGELASTDSDGDGLSDVYDGNAPPTPRSDPSGLLGTTCSDSLLNEALPIVQASLPPATACSAANIAGCVDALSQLLLTGLTTPPTTAIDPAHEVTHYLCVDTGLFDSGPAGSNPNLPTVPNDDTCKCRGGACNYCKDDFATEFDPYSGVRAVSRYPTNNQCEYMTQDGICDDGGPNASSAICALGTDKSDCGARAATDTRIECPPDSKVIFFTVDPTQITQSAVDTNTCQAASSLLAAFGGTAQGTCATQLEAWRQQGKIVQENPSWKCTDNTRAYCDSNRADLREGKTFFQAAVPDPSFPPLTREIAQAFRYKTQFLGRSGTGIGFVPEICGTVPELRPYCYDPKAIQRTRERVDCLLHLFDANYADFSPTGTTRPAVAEFLTESLAYAADPNARQAVAAEGFERLEAELHIMMGDEAFMRAFASRFDLAAVNAAAFDGVAFEGSTGLSLSGVAGYELSKLYEATQHYALVMNRFYSLSPAIWRALAQEGSGAPARNFVTQGTVTTYLDRVIKASTQKARAYSEIASRYQNFNQASLARAVIERAYSAAYLESQMLARLLLQITAVLAPSEKPQVRYTMEQTQRLYNIALMNMREVYATLSDELNYFDYPPDYIPFPALGDPSTEVPTSAFEDLLPTVQSKVEFAAGREDLALASGRQFDSDTEAFQAELASLRNSYEDQLADICGTFTVVDQNGDERVFPAITTYAYLDDRLTMAGDPCGTVGNGSLYEAAVGVDSAKAALERTLREQQNTIATINQRMAAMEAECKVIIGTADMVWEANGVANSLRAGIRTTDLVVDTAMFALDQLNNIMQISDCETFGCAGAAIKSASYGAAAIAGGIVKVAGDIVNLSLETQIDFIDQQTAYFTAVSNCELSQIQYRNEVFDLASSMRLQDIDMRRGVYDAQLAISQVAKLRQQAKRLVSQRDDAIEMAINVAAAENDPNVRIYRNDAYFNADLAFYDALKALYRLTRIYEYYTSQSYDHIDELYLARMVQRGDINLENYLIGLENAFSVFNESYGNPDTRVLTVSVRDDVLKIPLLDGSNPRDRRAVLGEFRRQIQDVSRLDTNGYTVLPFNTVIEKLSPLTRNHKILYVEAELQGDGQRLGDSLVRVYLRQKGTGVVRSVTGKNLFYAFPERTAVVNAFINSDRPFDARIYHNYRLRDRPLVNTQWELVLNRVDETVNDDIDLNGLTDIVLYVYYTDFTAY